MSVNDPKVNGDSISNIFLFCKHNSITNKMYNISGLKVTSASICLLRSEISRCLSSSSNRSLDNSLESPATAELKGFAEK